MVSSVSDVVMVCRPPLGQGFSQHLFRCIGALAALIACVQFFANALQTGDSLLMHHFSDLTIRDLFANTDVHVRYLQDS